MLLVRLGGTLCGLSAPKECMRSRRTNAATLTAVWQILWCGPVCAHATDGSFGLLDSWNADWWLWVLVFLAGWLYARGVRRLRQAAGGVSGLGPWRFATFAAGWLTLALALLSPLDALSAQLFSAHMVQHELLMVVSAPLLILGRPIGPYAWALPTRWRQPAALLIRKLGIAAAVRALSRPLNAWIFAALALWLWHIPALFDAALQNEVVHTLQHLTFFFSALLFWRSLARALPARNKSGLALLSVVTTGLHSSLLGALLTFAGSVWYLGYASSPLAWRLTPLEDQQIGGLIMWIPGGLVYLAAALALTAEWLNGATTQRVSASMS